LVMTQNSYRYEYQESMVELFDEQSTDQPFIYSLIRLFSFLSHEGLVADLYAT
jgi:hypothetical protein